MTRPLLAAAAALALVALMLAGVAGAARSPSGQAAAKPTRIACLNKAGDATHYRRKPRSCAAYGPGASFGGGVNLKRLEWEHWGRKSATATGVECGFHLPCSDIPVKVRAYRRRDGCRGRRAYTRLKARSSFGTTKVKLPACSGPVSS